MIPANEMFTFERAGGKVQIVYKYSQGDDMEEAYQAELFGLKAMAMTAGEAIKLVMRKVEDARVHHQHKMLRRIT